MIQIGVKLLDRKGDATDFVEFDLSEVNFIDLWSATNSSAKVPCHHTTNGSYLSLQTLKDVSQAYKHYGFKAYDQSNVINENRISEIIPMGKGSKVIFKDGNHTLIRRKF
ncbi:LytTR family transcriptional regulator DNA-binding domain-containing protein [Paenibacillus maysiensis]|uniref:LytTR family transcriptional regulator DNA-binding domain-containing protein n=1 Tax=Paenibacillus maysiensis TaxID=1155954 RepID=UPI0004710E3A|nr:LytTR family transcriptional regulator DNA-binding domain-containing protein [Paenibacillus maysiensis]